MKHSTYTNIVFLFYFLLIFLLANLETSFACPAGLEYPAMSAKERQVELNGLNEIKSKIIEASSEHEQQILRNTKIIVCAHPVTVWAFAHPGGQIELSEGFLLGLNSFSDSVLMGAFFQIRHLEERWYNYIIRMRHYDKRPIKTLEEYAKLSPIQRQRWNSAKIIKLRSVSYIGAIAFVLAHELGHHAVNAFYTSDDPNDVKQNHERTADRWAARAMLKIGLPPYGGAAIANLYLHYVNFQNTIIGEGSQSHPPSLERTLQALEVTNQYAEKLYSNKQLYPKPLQYYLELQNRFNNLFEEKIRIFNRQQNIDFWIEATERGSPLAAFIAGRMYAEGISTPVNLENACDYYVIAAAVRYEPALYWAGQCYECGMGRAKNFNKALEFYEKGQKQGIGYAEYRYKVLKQSIAEGYKTTEICLMTKDARNRKKNALSFQSK